MKLKRITKDKSKLEEWKLDLKGIEMKKVVGSTSSVSIFENTRHVQAADKAFGALVVSSERLSNLLAGLEAVDARYCVFGGWLRDTLAPSFGVPAPRPRDVDLVATEIDVGALLDMLPTNVEPTIFGGVQSTMPPVPFDVWPLSETFLIKTGNLPRTFESLLHTADFNINAALYFPAQGGVTSSICDAGMLEALKSGRIAFNACDLPLPVLQCARLAAYAAKLKFGFHPTVLDFMGEILAVPSNVEKVVFGLEHYQSQEVADAATKMVRNIVEGRT